jgi:hypothetical protein
LSSVEIIHAIGIHESNPSQANQINQSNELGCAPGRYQMNKGQAYRFLNGAKLLKLLAKSGLFGVPCQAALTVSQELVQIVSTTWGRMQRHRDWDNSPNEKLRHFEMHEVLFFSDAGGCDSPCLELRYPDRMF